MFAGFEKGAYGTAWHISAQGRRLGGRRRGRSTGRGVFLCLEADDGSEQAKDQYSCLKERDQRYGTVRVAHPTARTDSRRVFVGCAVRTEIRWTRGHDVSTASEIRRPRPGHELPQTRAQA